MVILLYIFIVLLSTSVGALVGLGGGVIIKPLLDIVGVHDISTIGFYSSFAVFVMCIVSIAKQIKSGYTFSLRIVLLISFGSLIGGAVGEKVLNFVIDFFNDNTVKIIQSTLLVVTLICILIYTLNKDKIRQYKLTSPKSIFIAGLFLGLISIFLGIGGGPLNVAFLMMLFSYSMKDATIYSVATTVSSQISKLGSVVITNKLFEYDISILPFICVAAIFGGFIGTTINQKLNNKKMEQYYIFIIEILIFISCYNVVSSFR